MFSIIKNFKKMEKNELEKKWKGRYKFGVDRYNSFAFDRYFEVIDLKTGLLVDTSRLRYADDEIEFCVAIDMFLCTLERMKKFRDLGI
jgi:hypothetical protein